MEPSIAFRPATSLVTDIKNGELSPVTVVDACFERIEQRNDEVNAFVTLLEEDARQQAKEKARAVESGEELGPLHGLPVAIKDLGALKAGVRNTFGSQPFSEFVPTQTATFVRRLEAAGAIVVGKTNTAEFGHKGTTDNPVFGATSTPFDLAYNAGGSSGGSAAAVADGMVPLAQASDAGGSIRIPASCCGVVGYKPSFGRVANAVRPDGFFTHTPFVHHGPIGRSVEDVALMLSVMAGPDPRDPFSLPEADVDYVGAVEQDIGHLDIGYSTDFGVFPVRDDVTRVFEDAISAFETAGATVERSTMSLPGSAVELAEVWRREIGVMYQSSMADFQESGIDLLADHGDELSPGFREILADTEDLTVREHKRDEHIRTQVFDEIQDALTEYDLLVTPTLAVPTVRNSSSGDTVGPSEIAGTAVDPLIGWCLTFPLNFTGHPAASVPAGMADGLPVGLQIIGPRFDDERVMAASGAFERVRPWADWYPPGN
jgi:Asp-tRNA(Asn)/Glu-tRNA(Gln) amidotransferase A subunit family amidase